MKMNLLERRLPIGLPDKIADALRGRTYVYEVQYRQDGTIYVGIAHNDGDTICDYYLRCDGSLVCTWYSANSPADSKKLVEEDMGLAITTLAKLILEQAKVPKPLTRPDVYTWLKRKPSPKIK